MNKSILTLAMISAIAAPLAMAEQPSFNYVEGGYSSFDDDADGYLIRGNVELSDMLYLNGSYTSLTPDDTVGDDYDYEIIEAGVGLQFPINKSASLYTEANYYGTKVDSDTEDGYTLALGLRAMLTDTTELYGEVANVELIDTRTDVTIGARQYLSDNFGIFAEYVQSDLDFDSYNVGVTYKF